MQREDRNAASVGARMRQEAISQWENEGGSVAAGWLLPEDGRTVIGEIGDAQESDDCGRLVASARALSDATLHRG